MKYKLIALDLDDTLINSNFEVTARTVRAIHRAKEKGAIVSLCTGRMYRATERFRKLGVDGLTVSYGGARITNPENDEILYRCSVAPEVAEELIAFAHQRGIYIQAYTETDFLYEIDNEYSQFYEEACGFPGVKVDNLLKLQLDTPKLLMADRIEAVNELLPMLREKFKGNAVISTSRANFLEIMDPKVSKAAALEQVANMLGIQREEIIAVGDGRIDKSMIAYAGLGVAMGNASAEVKEVADVIAPTNNEDGVAYIIEKYILNEG